MNTIKRYFIISICFIALAISINCLYCTAVKNNITQYTSFNNIILLNTANDGVFSMENPYLLAESTVRVKEKPEPDDPNDSEEC